MSLNITPTHPTAESYVSLAEAETYLDNRVDTTAWDALTDDQKSQLLKIATRQIDSFRFFECKMFDKAKDYRLAQKLEFPRNDHFKMTAQVSFASTNKVVCSSLAGNHAMPDDFFNGGAVIVINGTGKGQTMLVSDFVMETGEFTLSGNWTTQPDTTSQIIAVAPIDSEIKEATIEQAYFLSKGGSTRSQMQADGVTSYRIGDLSETFSDKLVGSNIVKLSSEAEQLLRGYISVIGELV